MVLLIFNTFGILAHFRSLLYSLSDFIFIHFSIGQYTLLFYLLYLLNKK